MKEERRMEEKEIEGNRMEERKTKEKMEAWKEKRKNR